MAMINVGDRVKTIRDLSYGRVKAGTLGTVVEKYVPHWATGCWTITVEFDGDVVAGRLIPTQLPYPDGTLELVESRNRPTKYWMGYHIPDRDKVNTEILAAAHTESQTIASSSQES